LLSWGEGAHHLEQQPDLVRLLTSGTPFFEALVHQSVAYYSRVPNLLSGTGWGNGVGELALEPVRASKGATWVLAVVRPPSEHGWTPQEKALLHRVARSVVASAGWGFPLERNRRRGCDVPPQLRVRYGLQVRFLRLEQARILETELGGLAGLPRY